LNIFEKKKYLVGGFREFFNFFFLILVSTLRIFHENGTKTERGVCLSLAGTEQNFDVDPKSLAR